VLFESKLNLASYNAQSEKFENIFFKIQEEEDFATIFFFIKKSTKISLDEKPQIFFFKIWGRGSNKIRVGKFLFDVKFSAMLAFVVQTHTHNQVSVEMFLIARRLIMVEQSLL